MPKRTADTQLTPDNDKQYLDEEESEEVRIFSAYVMNGNLCKVLSSPIQLMRS